MNLARINISEAHLELPFTVLTAAIAGCAAVGISFLLVLSAPQPPSPLVIVPGLGVLFSLFLVLVTDRSAARARHEAEARALSDPASGLVPAHLGRRLLTVAFGAARRGQPLTIVLFNIDGLANYRSVQGQPAAMRVLRNAGRVLSANTRGMHLSSRYNGDAVFLSILTGVPLEGATTYAQRVRKEYSRLAAAGEPQGLSAAVVTYESGIRSVDALLEKARKALTKATAAGNQLVVVEPTTLAAVMAGKPSAREDSMVADENLDTGRRWP